MKDHNVKQYPITLTGMAGGIGSTRFYYAASGGGGSSPKGQQEYITPGTHTWTCPAGVTSVSVVCIGGGGTGGAYGGSGGSLAYKNDITVVPGQTYTIIVGNTNSQISGSPYSFTAESSSAFGTVASGGEGGYSGSASYTRKTIGSNYDGGGRGGLASGDFYQAGIGYKEGAGGGAGGYSGDGGDAGKGAADGTSGSPAATAGSGGGGGGGCPGTSGNNAGGGGGTGIYGQGTSGAAAGGNSDPFGKGGSGGGDGTNPYGGQYGGGSGGVPDSTTQNMNAQHGAVRIIWPGTTRQFPNTGTADYDGWPYNLDNMEFTGLSPNYRWRSQNTSGTQGVYLKPDGTALYVLQLDGIVRRHNMSTAYDIGTASYSQASGMLDGGANARGLVFKPDGTKLFYLNNNVVKIYTLSNAWDLSTAIDSGASLNISSNLVNSNNSTSLNFKTDGSKLYVSESGNSTDNYIHQWTLSTSWTFSNPVTYGQKSVAFSGTNRVNVIGFSWKSDGTAIYVTHGSYYLARWAVSTAWDITTVAGSTTWHNYYYNVVESMTGKGMNLQWKSDGTIYYAPFGSTSNMIAQFEPSTAWTPNSVANDSPGDDAKYVKYRLAHSSMSSTYCTNWNADGTILYHVDGGTTIRAMTASTPYDIKTLSYTSNGQLTGTGWGTYDIRFNSDGTKLLALNCWNNKKVFEYTLSTGFDLSTISATGTTLDLTTGGNLTSFVGGCISDDGKYVYANNSSNIKQFTLSTPFNLSTASYTRQESGFSMSGWDGMCKISPDGTQLITHKNSYPGDNEFRSYELTTPWDISTKVHQKTVKMHDVAPHVPPMVHSAGWTIANQSWYFFGYYRYFGIQVDFT